MPVEAPTAPPPAPASPPPPPPQMPPIAPPVDIVKPRPGSARERLSQGLQKISKTNPDESRTPPTTETPNRRPSPAAPTPPVPKPGDQNPPAPRVEDHSAIDDEDGEPPATPPADPKAAPADPNAPKPKANPWKLLNDWKTKAAELEKQLVESKTGSVIEAEKKTYLERIEKAEARVQDLEKEIYFVDYSKSAEFQEKYDKPYQKAWAAMEQEFADFTIEDPETGQHRIFGTNDINALLGLDLKAARALANERYGELADDVMSHRKEIQKVLRARNEALKEAREKGFLRDKERSEMQQKTQKELSESVMTAWTKFNEEVTKHEKYGPYFVPKEGDEHGNQRLAKGFELVDRAMRENPLDPKLSAEERNRIVQRQAVVRNRAAAFGRMKLQIDLLTARATELETELKSYKGSEPATKGSEPPTTQQPGSTRDRIFGALRNIAK